MIGYDQEKESGNAKRSWNYGYGRLGMVYPLNAEVGRLVSPGWNNHVNWYAHSRNSRGYLCTWLEHRVINHALRIVYDHCFQWVIQQETRCYWLDTGNFEPQCFRILQKNGTRTAEICPHPSMYWDMTVFAALERNWTRSCEPVYRKQQLRRADPIPAIRSRWGNSALLQVSVPVEVETPSWNNNVRQPYFNALKVEHRFIIQL